MGQFIVREVRRVLETVRILKSYGGTTGKWVVSYAHPWTVISPSVSFGPISVDFGSFLGDEWEWENGFTIDY
ncbi:hypothetical protein ACFOQM_07990 [Paenibacillus sp. GCM10012307]|uniref:Uncharacterized protein n=1 Tax=Paenibacillus roseus TaxID=2798579 RepID=A0A934J1U4_9BACL|nr:hypothetical protein [Paenibacillus roseus]MBJ6361230.1 hypothetical protein [Paenibacillus roseus]